MRAPEWSRLLANAARRLREAGIDSPRLDAELLLASALRVRRLDVLAGSDIAFRRATPAALRRFRALLARRARRVPLQYLAGEVEFHGRPFRVTPAVLVPRPETETLIDRAAAWLRSRVPSPASRVVKSETRNLEPGTRDLEPGTRDALRVVDIGTGSGAIAITLACERPDAEVVATDLSRAALAVARANARRHGVASRIRFLHGDLFAPLRRKAGRATLDARRCTTHAPPSTLHAERPTPSVLFDLVLSNPPYISTGALARSQPEVRDHEPRLATWGGRDGLAVIRRLVAEAPAFLAPGGALMIEVGAGQAGRVARLLRESRQYEAIHVTKDLAGIARVVTGRVKDCGTVNRAR
jgi:release factor glutamine methyltransferase